MILDIYPGRRDKMDPEKYYKCDSVDQDAYMELALLSQNPEVLDALEQSYESADQKGKELC